MDLQEYLIQQVLEQEQALSEREDQALVKSAQALRKSVRARTKHSAAESRDSLDALKVKVAEAEERGAFMYRRDLRRQLAMTEPELAMEQLFTEYAGAPIEKTAELQQEALILQEIGQMTKEAFVGRLSKWLIQRGGRRAAAKALRVGRKATRAAKKATEAERMSMLRGASGTSLGQRVGASLAGMRAPKLRAKAIKLRQKAREQAARSRSAQMATGWKPPKPQAGAPTVRRPQTSARSAGYKNWRTKQTPAESDSWLESTYQSGKKWTKKKAVPWMKEHPLATAGIGLGAGVVGAKALSGGQREY